MINHESKLEYIELNHPSHDQYTEWMMMMLDSQL